MWSYSMLLFCMSIMRNAKSFSFVSSRRLSRQRRPWSPLFQTRPNGLDSLLQSALSRAGRTLSYKTADGNGESMDDYHDKSIHDAQSIFDDSGANEQRQQKQDIALKYNNNPTIASTALAHSLWSHVLRPGIDSAIDATAGNGNDSLVLAQLLFSAGEPESVKSKLFCIDIQKQACENTERLLSSELSSDIMRDHVEIKHESHAPLTVPRESAQSVALVVYNLGFLPGANTKNEVVTNTETTITSLVDASLLIRIGGMLSVMTYPRTNRQEHKAVAAFLEGLALLSSSSGSWEEHLDALSVNDENINGIVGPALQNVQSRGHPNQTWRVYCHSKIGWTDAPVLFTGTRIK